MIEFEEIDASRHRVLIQLEKKLGVEFKKLELLNNALTHTSYANEKGKIFDNNERLEFLGDAVLELASSTYLFEKFPNMPEGELTKTRASIVCQQTLAELAERLELGKMLLLGHGEDASGGRTRTTNLEDTFEAIIGAIYLDSGWETAKNYVIRQLTPEFEKIGTGINPKDSKSQLQEIVQRNPSSKIEYVELSATGPDHMKVFEYAVKIDDKIFGTGTGRTKKAAEQTAAQKALEKFQK
ncbi:MAG: ribonuclease III [Selenomonadaceae bacterium]|nr:ribonuclease III [Selenomonadaceae bacterium]